MPHAKTSPRTRAAAWHRVHAHAEALNKRHMLWAWSSLVWVGFTDFYIRMCASGAWTDWRISASQTTTSTNHTGR